GSYWDAKLPGSSHSFHAEMICRTDGNHEYPIKNSECRMPLRHSTFLVRYSAVLPTPFYFTPVLPNPPEPRLVLGRLSASSIFAWVTGAMTIWAMRSPCSTVKESSPKFTASTLSSPL